MVFMKNLLIPLSCLLLGLAVSCQSGVEPFSSVQTISSGLTLQIQAPLGRGIAVEQWDVTSLDILIKGPVNRELTWKRGDAGTIKVSLSVGTYSLELVHHGVLGGKAVEARESASFSVAWGKVTVVSLIPGGLGTVQVGEVAPVPVPSVPQTPAEFRQAMVGTWTGTMTCPWQAPIAVSFTFRADGTYSSKADVEGTGPALYYGSDLDSPLKTYNVYDVSQTERKFGLCRLTVYFQGSETTVEEELQDLTVTGTTLGFQFLHLGKYGPVSVQLSRK